MRPVSLRQSRFAVARSIGAASGLTPIVAIARYAGLAAGGRALSTREPDDYIDARTLDSSTRRYARDAFRAVRAVQRSLEAKLALPP